MERVATDTTHTMIAIVAFVVKLSANTVLDHVLSAAVQIANKTFSIRLSAVVKRAMAHEAVTGREGAAVSSHCPGVKVAGVGRGEFALSVVDG